MDLEPVKRSARNGKKEEENIFFSRRSRDLLFRNKRDKLRLDSAFSLAADCLRVVRVCFIMMQKAAKLFRNNSLLNTTAGGK